MAQVRTLIRIARSAHESGDDLLLKSAAVELFRHGVTLDDIGLSDAIDNGQKVEYLIEMVNSEGHDLTTADKLAGVHTEEADA